MEDWRLLALCGGSWKVMSGSLGVVVAPRIVAPLKRWWLLGDAVAPKRVSPLKRWWLLGGAVAPRIGLP